MGIPWGAKNGDICTVASSVCWHRSRRSRVAERTIGFRRARSRSVLEPVMSFLIYILGAALFIGGIAWALVAAHVPTQYIAMACLILLGIGIFTGVTRTRAKDPS